MTKSKCVNEKSNKKTKTSSFFKGAAVVVGISIMTVKFLPQISSKLYKESVKKSKHVMNDTDWGPIIEKVKK